MTDFSIAEGRPSDSRVPHLRRGRCHGLSEGGACEKNNLVSKIQRSRERGMNKVIDCTCLACWVTRRCLFSSRRRSTSPATWWSPQSRRPSTLPSLALYKAKGKSAPNTKVISIGTTNTFGKIFKDQRAGRGEKEIIRKKLQLRQLIQKLSVARLALPPLGALHGLNCLSHKLGDGPRPVALTYVKLESGTSSQLDSRRTKRKSYFQCFTFDFFSMAIMKPDLLLKQHHPRSSVSKEPSGYSQVAMKEQTLCHDVGTTCAGASSYLFRISSIIG
ncbi:LOW QUALITY PROTEIN: hypothetical protein Cgig2_018874 [Carnegiea gigantea]|uniref:Uncharacterized protein n=1 Tax=Carnegiea gigantea TaxID=171969 RepID=A0A9Q1K9T3_9CARY|nr:LOW QUALITY PROTEIN: hypothetical protein Cgig2_018874 [Carnegiea gigantea]